MSKGFLSLIYRGKFCKLYLNKIIMIYIIFYDSKIINNQFKLEFFIYILDNFLYIYRIRFNLLKFILFQIL
jgi:hypothetical protein